MAVAHCSSVAVAALARGGPPELFIMMSNRPNRSTVPATRLAMVEGLSRSPGNTKVSAPVARRISSSACSKSAWVRLHIAILTPSWASTSAQARPKPLLAPPTMATFPSSSKSISRGTLLSSLCDEVWCLGTTWRRTHFRRSDARTQSTIISRAQAGAKQDPDSPASGSKETMTDRPRLRPKQRRWRETPCYTGPGLPGGISYMPTILI